MLTRRGRRQTLAALGDLDLSLAGFGTAPEPLLLLALAIVLDLVWPTRRRPGIFDLGAPFASLASRLAQRLHRPGRSQAKWLFRGTFVTLVVMMVAVAVGVAVAYAMAAAPFTWILALFLLLAAIAARPPLEDARALAKALTARDHRAIAVTILGAEAATLDEAALARATAVNLGRRLSAGLLAPAFWFGLAGMPGLFFAVAALATARVLPEESPRFAEFGLAATRLRIAVLILPDLLAALLIAIAAVLTPKASARRACGALTAGRNRYRLPRESLAAAAMAGALDMPVPAQALGKGGGERSAPRWSGDAGAVLRAAAQSDLRRVSYLYGVTCVLTLGAIVLLVLAKFAA